MPRNVVDAYRTTASERTKGWCLGEHVARGTTRERQRSEGGGRRRGRGQGGRVGRSPVDGAVHAWDGDSKNSPVARKQSPPNRVCGKTAKRSGRHCASTTRSEYDESTRRARRAFSDHADAYDEDQDSAAYRACVNFAVDHRLPRATTSYLTSARAPERLRSHSRPTQRRLSAATSRRDAGESSGDSRRARRRERFLRRRPLPRSERRRSLDIVTSNLRPILATTENTRLSDTSPTWGRGALSSGT